MTGPGIVLVGIAIAVMAVLGWYLARERRSKRPHCRLDPEYEYALREFGGRDRDSDHAHH